MVRAIREQNVQVAAGVLGAPPAPTDTTFQLSINAQGRLDHRGGVRGHRRAGDAATGRSPGCRDVGRLELGSNRYALRSLLDNQPAVAIGIFQRPGTNALAGLVRRPRARWSGSSRPSRTASTTASSTTRRSSCASRFARWSYTLFEAILLVVIVVMVFLQTWRASIIPLVAVPVSLIGTFAMMLPLGFSLNTLSLFGLVLAIGIVVDDAIVVVENVERHIELGLAPMDATRKAMDEVSGPIIAIALVLCAVFVPTAFISGLTGQFYRQFALTIAISTVISAFNSLTLSPALASRLLTSARRAARRLQRAIDRAVRLVLPAVQPLLHPRLARLCRRRVARAARVGAWRWCSMRAGRADRRRLRTRAAGLRPGAGQGLPRRVRAAARRRHARSHRAR